MDDNNKQPLEIPDNKPESSSQPIRSKSGESQKHKKQMKVVKIAYAMAILIAFGGALAAKIATEKALGEINIPIEQDYITIAPTEEPDFEVRQNVTDVPDTREETTEEITEKPTEKETEKPAETTEISTETPSPYAVPYKDFYSLPLSTDISRDYSPEAPVYNATMNYWKTHPAVDFKAPDGSQVKAIAYGKVTKVYTDSLLGTVIEIDHGNEVTAKYCGFNKDTIEVKKGDTVENGGLLGYLGTVPFEKTDISHLHFEIYYKGENVDPLELMGK